jgi:hypothetical protein
MAIDERMRAKYEPSSDIGNLIVLVTRRKSEQVGCQKGWQDRSARERKGRSAQRSGQAELLNNRAHFRRASASNHTRSARPAAAGPLPAETLCPSLRQLPILAAEL